ncbi:MAG TPA: hypothetical protein VEW93_06875 [Acidimicrobiales bacterium]|nr:hypothetical protein [Acidimicrobiales bacterium]
MLARESRSLIDLGVARNLDRAYVESWMRLADELEHVRDDLHNAQLTKDDIVNGAVPK